jgi:hypothetical protein
MQVLMAQVCIMVFQKPRRPSELLLLLLLLLLRVSDLVVSQLVGGADGAQCTGLLDIEHLHSVRVVGCSTRPRKKETWQEVQLRIS